MSSEKMPVQVPLNSKYDIIAELGLIIKLGITAHEKWHEDENCAICIDPMKDQYVLSYPCTASHTFHRNCVLTNLLHHGRVNCPSCLQYPTPRRDV